jgi:tRNA A-37 threonylcarbamoyl transferase component Bud32
MAMTSGAETPLPMLARLDDISPEWLQAMLAESGFSDAPVASIEFQAIGAGNASDTQRILISYDGGRLDAPASLICKFHPCQEEERISAAALGTFAREIGSYSVINESKTCKIPTPYLLAHDEGHLNLVIEDLSQTARAGNQIAGCDATDAEAVTLQMAGLHGAFACLQESNIPPWLMDMSTMGDLFTDAIMAGAALAPDRFGDLLSAQQYSTISQCAELTAAWYQLPWQHLTLTHGDLRVDNVLFQERGRNLDAVLIDWQMTGMRNPMYDLAYFLSSSMSVEDRREHERRLLALYLDALAERLPGYSEQQAITDYRLSMIASLTTNLLAAVALPRTPAANTLILTLLKRGTSAAEDWDSLAAIRSTTS